MTNFAQNLSPDVLTELKNVAGVGNWRDQPDALQKYNQEWRGDYRGEAQLVLLPADTASVARLVKICARHHIAIVPQGGNTGLVGGAVAARHEIILSLEHMTKLRQLDYQAGTMIIEAGATLAAAQSHAAAHNLLFPLHLASQSRCHIGGNLSTNAGGMAVLKYGSMRDLTLGLEVVLPDGAVISQLGGLRKDNTGYDLRHIFIGAEGTLGIITAASLKLFPSVPHHYVAWVGFGSPAQALALLAELRQKLGHALSTFEIMNRQSLALVLAAQPETRSPLSGDYDWHGLIVVEAGIGAVKAENEAELAKASVASAALEIFEKILADFIANGGIKAAILASSDRQAQTLMALREAVSDAQKPAGASIKHDLSLPLSQIPDFLVQAAELVAEFHSGTRIVAFGHIGDGNIHYNLSQPSDQTAAEFLARRSEISHRIYKLVTRLGGSISAEHGIGLLRRQDLLDFTPEAEIALMRQIKRAFDPQNIMNPGKILAN